MKTTRTHHTMTTGGKLLSLLLAALLCVQLLPVTAQAADGIVPQKETYALVTVTGNASPQDVQYLAVTYRDDAGKQHSEYIFPRAALRQTMQEAANVPAGASSANVRRTASTALARKLTGLTAGSIASAEPFRNYARDTFFFYPQYAVGEIVQVEIFNKDRSSWACQSMELYKVSTLYGLDSYDAAGSGVFVSFAGTLLAATERGTTFTGTLNTVGGGNSRVKFRTAFSAAEAAYDNSDCRYALHLDMADSYGAGLEPLAAPATGTAAVLSAMGVQECLLATVRYKTAGGAVVCLRLPMVTDAVGWAAEQGIDPDKAVIADIGQDGGQLTAGVRLPDFASLEQVELTVTSASDAAAVAAMEYSGGAEKAADNDVRIAGAALYDLRLTPASVSSEGGALTAAFSGMPAYYYTAASTQGYPLAYGTDTSIAMRAYQAGSGLTPRQDVGTTRFLVVLHTDAVESAGTTGDLSMQLSYMDTDGSARESTTINVREAIREFTGYWPSTVADPAYRRGMEPGGELKFAVTLKNVSYFTGVTFSVNNGDDWQGAGISIYRLDKLDSRTVSWGDVTIGGAVVSNRSYTRQYSGELILSSGTTVLVQEGTASGGGKKTISVISDSVISQEDVDWSDVRYSMSYEQANRDLGFTKSRQTYTVVVEVADDTTSTGSNGDCGSKNQFYFQLVFQSGKSGYVLANQQLTADGFRAGVKESFSISTNQDYGELVEVRIIPNDSAGNDYTYDKLNIASIRVRKNSTGALSRQWVLDNVGWVDVNYRDDAAAVSEKGQSSRSEAEIARSYLVSYSSNVVNLMVCVTTDQFDEYDGITTPFSGELMAEISYYNGAGELCTPEAIDVVRAIYEYNNKTANYDKASVTVNADGTTSLKAGSHAVSDTATMFRPNKADRFILSIDDISSLNSITFTGKAAADCRWKIKSVAVALVTGDGELQLNSNNEYIRTGEMQPLCTHASANTPAYLHDFLMGDPSSFTVQFSDNTIQSAKDESTWVSAVTREPLSQNDTLNIYVYPKNTANMAEYELSAAAQFSTDYGVTYQSAVKQMSRTGTYFYATGVGATGMSVLRSLTLKADDTTVQAQIDYALVEQVRSGVVIATYRIEYNGYNAAVKISNGPTSGKAVETGEQQEVYLQLGEGTQTASLFAQQRDLAVSLRYTTSIGSGGSAYNSANIFLTDQQINAIKAGDVVRLTFSQPYVKEITGLTVTATGGLKVVIDRACIIRYDGTSSITTGFANGVTLTGSGATMTPTNTGSGSYGTVTPVTLTFRTAEDTESAKTALNGGLPAEITCVDVTGNNVSTMKVADLTRYISSGSIAPGKTAVVTMLLADANEITALRVTPDGTWYLAGVSASVTGGSSTSVEFGRLLPSGETSLLDMKAVNVALTVTRTVGGSTVTEPLPLPGALRLTAGESVTLTPTITGTSAAGFTATVNEDGARFLSASGGSVTFTPVDVVQETVYTLTIVPDANKESAVTVTITVLPAAGASGGTDTPET